MSDHPREHEADGIIAEIREVFSARGASLYGGEAVTQLEHGLQAAQFAECEEAAPE